MKTFRVVVYEHSTVYREKVFEAETEDEARELAEAEDWRSWEEIDSSSDCYIDSIDEE